MRALDPRVRKRPCRALEASIPDSSNRVCPIKDAGLGTLHGQSALARLLRQGTARGKGGIRNQTCRRQAKLAPLNGVIYIPHVAYNYDHYTPGPTTGLFVKRGIISPCTQMLRLLSARSAGSGVTGLTTCTVTNQTLATPSATRLQTTVDDLFE